MPVRSNRPAVSSRMAFDGNNWFVRDKDDRLHCLMPQEVAVELDVALTRLDKVEVELEKTKASLAMAEQQS